MSNNSFYLLLGQTKEANTVNMSARWWQNAELDRFGTNLLGKKTMTDKICFYHFKEIKPRLHIQRRIMCHHFPGELITYFLSPSSRVRWWVKVGDFNIFQMSKIILVTKVLNRTTGILRLVLLKKKIEMIWRSTNNPLTFHGIILQRGKRNNCFESRKTHKYLYF